MTYNFNSSDISSQSIKDIIGGQIHRVQYNKDPRVNQLLKQPKLIKAAVTETLAHKRSLKYEFWECPDYIRENKKLMEVVESKAGKLVVKGGNGSSMLPPAGKSSFISHNMNIHLQQPIVVSN